MLEHNKGIFEDNNIETVQSITLDEFQSSFISRRKPLIVCGGILDWQAVSLWTPQYLGEALSDKDVKVAISDKNIISYEPRHGSNVEYRQMKMKEAAGLISSNLRKDKKYYITQHALDNFDPILNDFGIPSFADKSKSYLMNLWFGEAGNITPLHFDFPHNLLAQVYGRKQVKLFSPEDSEFLYPAYDEELSLHSRILDIDNPDYAEFPNFKNAKPYVCTLRPGDVLFMPSGWWHQVYSLDIAISINFWWRSTLDQTLLTHVSRRFIRDLYERGKLLEVRNILDLSSFKNNLAVAKYLCSNNYKWLAILFGVDFLESYLSKKSRGSIPYNQVYSQQTFLKKNIKTLAEKFSIPISDLEKWIHITQLAKKEDDKLLAEIDVKKILDTINLFILNLEQAIPLA